MAVPISNVVRRVVFAPSGVGPYAFTFEILANTDIEVYKGNTLLTLTTDYTVTINANGTGSVTLVVTAGADNITIVGARTIERTTDFVTGGDLFANSLNEELDSLTIFVQQNSESGDRAIKAPVTDPTTIDMTLPVKTTRANKVLSFNSSTGNPETNITVTAIQNAETNATNAAASAAAAASSASAASGSASSASGSASSATSSASSATSSASTATTQASNASASASAAASSASTATTQAGIATTQAGNASTSASNASTSATNASNSATSAQSAQTAAESARDSTLAAFDSFDDRYLGTKTSDPTLDNDGNALVAGALYFNSVSGIMKVYTGSAWVAAYVSGSGFVDLSSAQTITGVKTFDNGLATDTISEETSATGVTIDGVLLKDSEVTTDVIKEKTSATGVTVDSVLLKDGMVVTDSSMNFRNRIINGAMVIDQRNAGASVTFNDETFPVDRFRGHCTQTSKLTAQRSSTAPAGFSNSLLLTSSSAYSVTSGDIFVLAQGVEGFNVGDLGWGTANAQTITLSFWVRSSLTGTFGGALRNSAGNRAYPFTYTINSANTFEYKTVTVVGDTSGTWLTDNGVGIRLVFSLGAGSTYSGTAGAWAGSNFWSATGATSVVGTNGATFYITGVQLEVGSVATPFERRPYGTELQLCQRYYQYDTTTTPFVGNTTSGSTYGGNVFLRTSMRAAPTVTQTHVTSSGFPGVAPTSSEITTEKFLSTKASDGTGNGNFYRMTWVATAEL